MVDFDVCAYALYYEINPHYYIKEATFSELAITEENSSYKTRIDVLKRRNWPDVYTWMKYETDLPPRKAKKWVHTSISLCLRSSYTV